MLITLCPQRVGNLEFLKLFLKCFKGICNVFASILRNCKIYTKLCSPFLLFSVKQCACTCG